MFLKTPKFGMQQNARIFSVLPTLNLFHILTQDTVNNHLKKKKTLKLIILTKTLFLTKNDDF